jgi:TPR repeat protein
LAENKKAVLSLWSPCRSCCRSGFSRDKVRRIGIACRSGFSREKVRRIGIACRSGFSRDRVSGYGLKSWLKPLLRPVLLALAFSGAIHADYQDGLDAYQAGDYATAMAEWKKVVNKGPENQNLAIYRESLYAIGMLHWTGEGVPLDYSVSAVWFKQAADINHPGAQVKLGYLYSTGQGVPQNFQEAQRWFEMAAAQGDPDAKHNLDVMFRAGLLSAKGEVKSAAEPVVGDRELAQGPVEQAATAAAGTEFAAPVQADTAAIPVEKPKKRIWPKKALGEEWILEQNPERYTIQVIALSKPDKLREFVAAHPEWAPFAIYTPSELGNRIWILLQGVYDDPAAARSAKARFPPGLEAPEKLWIRKYGRVRELLN